MACHRPCIFKLGKNKCESLYSVKSRHGTEPMVSLAHSKLKQFGNETDINRKMDGKEGDFLF